MLRITRTSLPMVLVSALVMMLPILAEAQGRGGRGGPPPPGPSPTRAIALPSVRGQVVFIGGYFYDPFYGPYPWWPRTAYPYWYFPIYNNRAEVRLQVTPDEAAVYVDGFYAGVVDDFDGFFESLALPPGGHQITLYLEGYRTVRTSLYLRPGSTFKVREVLVPLSPGQPSEPPPMAAPVPPPPEGTYILPVTPARVQPRPTATPAAVGFGVVELRVRPPDATVLIDGEPWMSSDDGRFTIQISVGAHRIEASAPGRERYSTSIQVREGETTTLDVMLSTTDRR